MAFETAANAGDQRIRQAAFGSLHLLLRLLADDRLEVAHHRRIGMRTCRRADAIESVGDIGDPVRKASFIAPSRLRA